MMDPPACLVLKARSQMVSSVEYVQQCVLQITISIYQGLTCVIRALLMDLSIRFKVNQADFRFIVLFISVCVQASPNVCLAGMVSPYFEICYVFC